MTVSWLSSSEITFGLVLRKQLDPIHIPPEQIAPPYDEMLGCLKQGKSEEEIIELYGLEYVQAAYDAADSVEGTPFDFLKVLATAYRREQQATQLERMTKTIRKGGDVTLGDVSEVFTENEDGDELIPMGELEIVDVKREPTGIDALDQELISRRNRDNRGIPLAQITVVGATPGAGKTTLAIKMAVRRAKLYKKKTAIFTLEMTNAQIALRAHEIDHTLTKEERNRVLLNDRTGITPGEIASLVTRAIKTDPEITMVIIDYASLLVDEEEESSISRMYRQMQRLAKQSAKIIPDGIALVILSQLSRANGGVMPKSNHLRYSGMIEAVAGMIILPWNPKGMLIEKQKPEDKLKPPPEGYAYLIIAKSKFGFGEQDGPFAIMLEMNGETGWGDESTSVTPIY
jgi:hypothetical protein